MNMKLIIFFLNDEAFDTVQFFESDAGSWRIKTYALDRDVHIWSLGGKLEDIVSLARSNTEEHYGDVLSEGYVLESDTGIDGLRVELADRGLSTHLEISDTGLVFWAPEKARHSTKSKPR